MIKPHFSIPSGIIRFLSLKALLIAYYIGLPGVHFLLAADTDPGQAILEGQKHPTIMFDLNNNSSDQSMAKVAGNAPFDASGSFLSYDKQTFYISGSSVYIRSGEMHCFRTSEDQWNGYINVPIINF